MIRVLLDEVLDIALRQHFASDIEVETVTYRGWNGLPNGELLRRAERDYDVFVTPDRNIPAQQNLAQFKIAVVILCGRSLRLEDLLELIPEVNRVLPTVRPGEVAEIHPPEGDSD